jgi:hypothetical protein
VKNYFLIIVGVIGISTSDITIVMVIVII